MNRLQILTPVMNELVNYLPLPFTLHVNYNVNVTEPSFMVPLWYQKT